MKAKIKTVLVLWYPQSDVLGVACTPENESTPNDSKLKAYLKCLNKIESAITAKKK